VLYGCVLLISGCSSSPVTIPTTEPRDFEITGADQCTTSGAPYAQSLTAILRNYDNDPVVSRAVLVTGSGTTVNGQQQVLMFTNSSGALTIPVAADSLPAAIGPTSNASVTFRVDDRPLVEGTANLSVSQRAWGIFVSPDSTSLCRNPSGTNINVLVDVILGGNCSTQPPLPNSLGVWADDQAAGTFRQVTSLPRDMNDHFIHDINFQGRSGVITVQVRDQTGVMPNRPQFTVSRCQ